MLIWMDVFLYEFLSQKLSKLECDCKMNEGGAAAYLSRRGPRGGRKCF